MNPTAEWVGSVALSWWSYIVHAGWQAALVGMGLLALVNVAGRRWPAPLRYALLVVALLKFACPPLLPFPTGVFTQFSISALCPPTPKERKPTLATEPQGTALDARDEAGGRAFPSLSGPFGWVGWLMVLHLAGTATVVVLIVRRARQLRNLARVCRSRLDSGLHEQYRDLAIQMRVYCIPPLGISDQVEAPMAFGVPKAAIILPSKIVGRLSPSELKAVLAHELAHCWRGDLWLTWIQLILAAVWWFHPVVWLVNRSLREVREDCCDDLLLARRIVSNDAYCDVLLRAASHLCPSVPLSAALGFSGRLHPLARRMARITDWTLCRSENVSGTGALAVLLAAAVLLPGGPQPAAPAASATGLADGPVATSATPVGGRQPVAPERPATAWQQSSFRNRQAAEERVAALLERRSARAMRNRETAGSQTSVASSVKVATSTWGGDAPQPTAQPLAMSPSPGGRAQTPNSLSSLPAPLRPPTPGILEPSQLGGTFVRVVSVQVLPRSPVLWSKFRSVHSERN